MLLVSVTFAIAAFIGFFCSRIFSEGFMPALKNKKDWKADIIAAGITGAVTLVLGVASWAMFF